MVTTRSMLILLSFALTLNCDFSSAFRKALDDFKISSFGANPDRFCSGSSGDELRLYLSGYELGQSHAKLISDLEIKSIPQTQEEIAPLMQEAERAQQLKRLESLMRSNNALLNEVKAENERLQGQNRVLQEKQKDLLNDQKKIESELENLRNSVSKPSPQEN